MPRITTRPLVLTLALVALLALSPAAATALPQREAPISAAEIIPDLFSEFWGLLSALWSDTGAGLDPNGATSDTGPGLDPDGVTGDTGPWLDPNG
jgi:hypothetical protein